MGKQKNTSIKKKTNKNSWLVLGGIVIIAFAVLIGFQLDNNVTSDLPLEVSVSDAYKIREEGAFVLDVRQPEEWEAVHIPGATLIPLGELESRLDEVPQDQNILVVCRSGNRSARARDILLNAGFQNVSSMAGGMNEWVAKSYDIGAGP